MINPSNSVGAVGRALLVMVATGLLGACQYGEVQEPWVSGDQYQQEIERSPEVADALRHRAWYNQIDR